MRKILPLVLALSGTVCADTLESQFKNPPVQVRPYVWWHWMGSNFSKEGITKDLEAMKASGIGGATIFNIASAVQESHKPTENNPWPDQTYRSPKYWEALRHAAAEADRLGLEIGLHNTVGYSTTGGPWVDAAKNMQNIVSQSIKVEGGKKITTEIPRPEPTQYRGWGNSGQSFDFYADVAVLAVPADGTIGLDKLVDLSAQFKNNQLEWDAPPGKWEIVRFSHVPTGANPHPLPDELIGKTLEVDKLSRELNQFHWNQVVDPIKEHLGPLLGKSFRHFLIDSYEAGKQSWTPKFREEFKLRKGYDPLPWLLTTRKRVVEDKAQSARFEWDYNDVLRALFYENGWLVGVEKMKSVGADLQFEAYGGQFDTIEGSALADIPMGEFWTGRAGGINGAIVAAARAAGRTVVGAEAFTGSPKVSQWTETPAFLKRSADGTFASGANRMILHHWVHQPFDDRYKPGMGMGWWGTHFNRHQTWVKDGKAFFQYLGRAQALLQAGEAPADYVSIGKPHSSGDVIAWRTFRGDLTVRDGRIVLPSGREYAFLSIPHDGAMLPKDLEKVADLLERGATIVSAKPTYSPGLMGYPESDKKVVALAAKLWNDEPVRRIGKGKLYTHGDIGAALKDLNITPQVQIKNATGIVSTARVTKTSTIYFLANPENPAAQFTASFRVSGKRPELWNAETGTIRFAPIWRQREGRTEVDLSLDNQKSIFVVFRSTDLPADHVVAIEQAKNAKSVTITSARFGTAQNNRWMDVTSKLQALANSGTLNIAAVTPSLFGKDPASGVVKQLEVTYTMDGKSSTKTVAEGEAFRLGEAPPVSQVTLHTDVSGMVRASGSEAMAAELVFASGKREKLNLAAPAAPNELSGPWQVRFDSSVDKIAPITMEKLQDLSKHSETGVKYFSGTATYTREFTLADANVRLSLDLGKVADLARVTLNGKDLGVLWHPPFTVDLTPALKKGNNQLEIAVTNTWHNRLVGDEQHPADFEWGEDRGGNGHAMKAYPEWFLKNQPRPEQNRKCFVIWYYHRKDTPLVPAGLLGPVKLVPEY